jgi:PBP1b-binding outer membrane lipoprotein LpoB
MNLFNKNKRIIILLSLTVLLTGCIGHKTNIHDEPINFTVYETHVTMDKDGVITYYPSEVRHEVEATNDN